jgi:hypothetical protein
MSFYDTLGRTPWFPRTISYQRLFRFNMTFASSSPLTPGRERRSGNFRGPGQAIFNGNKRLSSPAGVTTCGRAFREVGFTGIGNVGSRERPGASMVDQATIRGRTSANLGYSKPLFACVHPRKKDYRPIGRRRAPAGSHEFSRGHHIVWPSWCGCRCSFWPSCGR